MIHYLILTGPAAGAILGMVGAFYIASKIWPLKHIAENDDRHGGSAAGEVPPSGLVSSAMHNGNRTIEPIK
jgi:hypothetical protein